MNSYEEAILAIQEEEHDECATCPYKGADTCNNQCAEEVEIENYYLKWRQEV